MYLSVPIHIETGYSKSMVDTGIEADPGLKQFQNVQFIINKIG